MTELNAAEVATEPADLVEASVDLRRGYAAHYAGLLIEHMRDAHALSGVMVAALERGDLDDFAAIGPAFNRAIHAAGAASLGLSHLGSSDGIA